MNSKVNRLHDIARKGLAWYGEDMGKRDFGHIRYFNNDYGEKQRIAIIQTLMEVYETLPIIQKGDGIGIDTDRWTGLQQDIVYYAYYDLSAKVLRGTVTGKKIKPKAFPEVNRWNPLLIYVLSMKHGIPYEDFRPAKALFGRDLRDLLIKINENQVSRISVQGRYYVGPLHTLLREENPNPSEHHPEEAHPDDEDRINYANYVDTSLIPNYSAWAYALSGMFPDTYHAIPALYKMPEEHMINLMDKSIINRRPIVTEF